MVPISLHMFKEFLFYIKNANKQNGQAGKAHNIIAKNTVTFSEFHKKRNLYNGTS